jgi:hypothetical protein
MPYLAYFQIYFQLSFYNNKKTLKIRKLRATPHPRQPAAKPQPTKAKRRRVCGGATVLRNQRKKNPFFG